MDLLSITYALPFILFLLFFKEAGARVRKMAEGPPSLIDFCLLFELRCARCEPIASPIEHFFQNSKVVQKICLT